MTETEEREKLEIIVGEETFYTDPSALAEISPVFSAMLQAPLMEKRTNVINIEDADSRSFEILLEVCGVLRSPSSRINSVVTAVGLLRLGQRYLIREVEVPSLLYLQQHVTRHTALYILQHLHLLYNKHFTGIAIFIVKVRSIFHFIV